MMVHLAHITLYADDIEKNIQEYVKKGYQLVFWEKGLKNPAIKASLMRQMSPVHDLAVLSKTGSISIELIDHGHCGNEGTPLRGVWDPEGNVVHTLRLQTTDLERSAVFWQAVGFSAVSAEDGLRRLSFFSPLTRQTYWLELEQQENISSWWLDNQGCTAVAFYSTNPSTERKRLEAAGISVTEEESLWVNGRELRLFFAWGGDGEKVEVIGYTK